MTDKPKTRYQRLTHNYLNFVNYHRMALKARQNDEPFELSERMYRHSLRRIYAIAKTYKIQRRWDYHNGFIQLHDDKLWVEYAVHLPTSFGIYPCVVPIKDGELDLEDYTP